VAEPTIAHHDLQMAFGILSQCHRANIRYRKEVRSTPRQIIWKRPGSQPGKPWDAHYIHTNYVAAVPAMWYRLVTAGTTS